MLFLAAAVAAGVLWEHWWTPPTGIVSGQEFFLDEQGLGAEFSGTGLYVVVALATGCLLGVLVAVAFRRHEMVTLVVTLAAAGVAGWVMARVGEALGPPDPDPLARGLEDWSPLVADLTVAGTSPYLALPIGALVGLAGAMFVEVLVRRFRESAAEPPSRVSD